MNPTETTTTVNMMETQKQEILEKFLQEWTTEEEEEEEVSKIRTAMSIDHAQSIHGMPWKTSIDPDEEDHLLYMPFWEWQVNFMKEHFKDL